MIFEILFICDLCDVEYGYFWSNVLAETGLHLWLRRLWTIICDSCGRFLFAQGMPKLLHFIKSENRHKLVKDGKILNCFYKCPSCGCRIKMFVPENLLFQEVGLFFFIRIVCTHCSSIKNVPRTNWLLPVNMEITYGASNTFRPEIPRIGESVSREDHSVVRRNLMNFFVMWTLLEHHYKQVPLVVWILHQWAKIPKMRNHLCTNLFPGYVCSFLVVLPCWVIPTFSWIHVVGPNQGISNMWSSRHSVSVTFYNYCKG